MDYKLVAFVVAILNICFVGYLDFKYRKVKYDFCYLIICACSVVIGGVWPEKVICLFAFPVLLFVISYIMEKKKNIDKPSVGGADIKLMTAMVFLFGLTQFSFIFIITAVLSTGHFFASKEKEIPLCGYLSVGTLLYCIAFWLLTIT